MPKLLLLSIIILCSLVGIAQEKEHLSKNPVRFYRKIKKFAEKREFTYWLYRAIFNEPHISPNPVNSKQKSFQQPENYNKNAGKIIRKIKIVTLDPFGKSVYDTSLKAKGFFRKSGNIFHVKSLPFVIKNQLLFKTGNRLDPLSVKESERILRQTSYLREASIRINSLPHTPDSVDVLVVVQDFWSLTGSGDINASSFEFSLREKNIAGLSHQLEHTWYYNFDKKLPVEWSGSYSIPNINSTFISAVAYYGNVPRNSMRGISINRPFYSPLTKWAGGLDVVRTYSASPDSTFTYMPLHYDQQDIWMGRSLQLKPGKKDVDRSARLILSSRLARINYFKKPSFGTDTLKQYQNSTLYLANIGYSTRTYYEEKNIYRFGEVEDVPEGRVLSFIAGYQKRETGERLYFGGEISIGNHLNNVGYVRGSFALGSFIKQGINQEGVVNTEIFYFTDQLRTQKWGVRQFIRCRYVKGIQRFFYESLTLNNGKDLYGFKNSQVEGTEKILLNLETVLYTPISYLGFQFAAVFFAGFGIVRNSSSALLKNHLYQAYGLGLLVRNKYLTISTFQISIGLYPNITGEGVSYKLNPINTFNQRLKDFGIGKPDLISYQ